MRAGKRRRLWTLGVLFLCLAAGLLWRALPRERPLLRYARRVIDTAGWEMESAVYQWKSDHEVLFWRPQYEKREYPPGFYRTDDILICHDIRTGIEQPLGIEPIHADRGPRFPDVSPDGMQLFWTYGDPDRVQRLHDSDGDLNWVYVPLPKAAHSTVRGGDLMRWMQDSHRWLMFDWIKGEGWNIQGGPQRIWMGDIRMPAKLQSIAIHPNSPLTWNTVDVFNSVCSSADTLLVMEGYDADKTTQQLTIYDIDPVRQGLLRRKYMVKLPEPAYIQEAAFSPQGDSIAWALRYNRVPSLLGWLHHLFSFIKVRPQPKQSLWISRVDGTGFHEVGYCSANDAAPIMLQWLPNGKTLSFIYKDALYTVPAD